MLVRAIEIQLPMIPKVMFLFVYFHMAKNIWLIAKS